MPVVNAYAAQSRTGPLVPTKIERRDVGPRDVLIQIKYAGICHSDIMKLPGKRGASIPWARERLQGASSIRSEEPASASVPAARKRGKPTVQSAVARTCHTADRPCSRSSISRPSCVVVAGSGRPHQKAAIAPMLRMMGRQIIETMVVGTVKTRNVPDVVSRSSD